MAWSWKAEPTWPLLIMLCLGGLSGMTPGAQGVLRQRYVAAVMVNWNYELQKPSSSLMFKKILYREYEANFLREKSTPAFSGILGPTLRAEVGDTLKVHFKNMADKPLSIHPQGIAYSKRSEGALYADKTFPEDKMDDKVLPGKEYTYVWEITEDIGPKEQDPFCLTYSYYSHENMVRDYNSGLIGALLICKRGSLNEDGSQKMFDQEFVLMFSVFDESKSWQKSASTESTLYTINGYINGNMPDADVCAYDNISWHFIGMSSKPEWFSIHFNGQVLEHNGYKVSVISLVAGTTTTANMTVSQHGRWLISSLISKHLQAKMYGYLNVKLCENKEVKKKRISFQERRFIKQWDYFIAAEEITWNYAAQRSENTDRSQALPKNQYKKVVYRQYADESFTKRVEQSSEKGILGPVISAQVKDTVKIIFKNMATRPYSIYPHGVSIPKAMEGAVYPHDSQDLPENSTQGHSVKPGETFTYEWYIHDTDVPTQNDEQCITRPYYSAVDMTRDIASGLIGQLLICKTLSVNTRALQRKADLEQHAVFAVFNENKSWYMEENMKKVYRDSSDSRFYSSNIIYTINGYEPDAIQTLGFCHDEIIRWYISTMGALDDILSVHVAGHSFKYKGRIGDVLNIFPMDGESVTVEMDNLGVWLLGALNSPKKNQDMKLRFKDAKCVTEEEYNYESDDDFPIEFAPAPEKPRKETVTTSPRSENGSEEPEDLTYDDLMADTLNLRSIRNSYQLEPDEQLNLTDLFDEDTLFTQLLNGLVDGSLKSQNNSLNRLLEELPSRTNKITPTSRVFTTEKAHVHSVQSTTKTPEKLNHEDEQKQDGEGEVKVEVAPSANNISFQNIVQAFLNFSETNRKVIAQNQTDREAKMKNRSERDGSPFSVVLKKRSVETFNDLKKAPHKSQKDLYSHGGNVPRQESEYIPFTTNDGANTSEKSLNFLQEPEHVNEILENGLESRNITQTGNIGSQSCTDCIEKDSQISEEFQNRETDQKMSEFTLNEVPNQTLKADRNFSETSNSFQFERSPEKVQDSMETVSTQPLSTSNPPTRRDSKTSTSFQHEGPLEKVQDVFDIEKVSTQQSSTSSPSTSKVIHSDSLVSDKMVNSEIGSKKISLNAEQDDYDDSVDYSLTFSISASDKGAVLQVNQTTFTKDSNETQVAGGKRKRVKNPSAIPTKVFRKKKRDPPGPNLPQPGTVLNTTDTSNGLNKTEPLNSLNETMQQEEFNQSIENILNQTSFSPRGLKPSIVIGIPTAVEGDYVEYIPMNSDYDTVNDYSGDEGYECVFLLEPYDTSPKTENQIYLNTIEIADRYLRSTKGNKRIFYIAAEEIIWDYTELKKSTSRNERKRSDKQYKKVVFRRYLDSTFKIPAIQGEYEEHLGILGPVLRAEVDDVIQVHFKNLASRPYSLHAHGVTYEKSSEGRSYDDESPEWLHKDDAVKPGDSHTYMWYATWRSGPDQDGSACKTWAYYSGVNPEKDIHSGLIGPLLICKSGTIDKFDGRPLDMREFILLFMTFDEEKSWYFEKKSQSTCTEATTEAGDAAQCHKFHAINGILYNLQGLRMYANETVRWHLLNMGGPTDIHSVHFHGQTFVQKQSYESLHSTYPLLPGSFGTIEMTPSKPGTWLLDTEVGQFQQAGMQAPFLIVDSECKQPMGLASGAIANNQITASNFVEKWEPHLARLNNGGSYNAWSTEANKTEFVWIQVDFLKPVIITGIQTQGAKQIFKHLYASQFFITYSNDKRNWNIFKGDSISGKKNFDGNVDGSSIKKNVLDPPISARYVRVYPTKSNNRPTLRMEFLGCEIEACFSPLGMESMKIKDDHITASSYYSSWISSWKPSLARLNKQHSVNAWQAKANNNKQWLQVDLRLPKRITGIVSQGARSITTEMFIKTFAIASSNNGLDWDPYIDGVTSMEKIFTGNENSNGHVRNRFNPPITSRFIRIIPKTWNQSIALRLELMGCNTS